MAAIMATVKQAFKAKVQTNKDAEIEEVGFAVGDEVSIMQTWEDFYLIKDAQGHFYNVRKELLEAA